MSSASQRKIEFKTIVKSGASRERARKYTAEMVKENRQAAILAKRFKGNATSAPETQEEALTSEGSVTSLAKAVELMRRDDLAIQVEGVRYLRRLLGASTEAVNVVIEAGLVPALCNFLTVPSQEIQVETAWCLTNIACGESSQVQHIMPAVPYLIQLLSHPNSVLQDQVCWALGNIAADSDEVRSSLVASGAVIAVAELLFASSMEMLSTVAAVLSGTAASPPAEGLDRRPLTAAWALSNLSRGTTPFAAFTASDIIARFFALTKSCLSALTTGAERDTFGGVIRNSTPPIVEACIQLVHELTWTFTFLSAKDEASVTTMITEDLGRIFCESASLYPAGSILCIPAIRGLGNITSGPIEWIDMLSAQNTPIGQVPLRILTAGEGVHRVTIKESLWVVSNILGGKDEHRESMLSSGVIDFIYSALLCGQFDFQREALFALQNACANVAVASHVCQSRPLLQCLVGILSIHDVEVVLSSMRVLQAMFRSPSGTAELCMEIGMMDKLDELMYASGNDAIHQFAKQLTDEIFEEGEDGEETESALCALSTGFTGNSASVEFSFNK